MFTRAAAGQTNSTGTPGSGRGFAPGRWASRVRGSAARASASCRSRSSPRRSRRPGRGRSGPCSRSPATPRVSTPNSGRLDRALESLDFMVSLDVYVNETTRHADVILPGTSPLRRSHYDVALYQLAVRNVANYSAPVLEPDPAVPDEWRTILRLTGIVTGQGPNADVDAIDDFVAAEAVRRELATPGSRLEGRDAGGDPRRARGPQRPRAPARPAAALRALRRPLRRRSRRAHPGRARGSPPRDRPRPARAPPPRAPCEPARARSSWRRSRSSPTFRACRRRSSVRRTAAWSWSAAASCAPTTPGCTTCRAWSAGRPAALPTSTPTTPSGSASATASRARCQLRRGRDRGPGGGHRRRDAGRCQHPARLGPRRRRRRAQRRPRATPARTATCSPARTWSTRSRATRSSTGSRSSSSPVRAAEPAVAG